MKKSTFVLCLLIGIAHALFQRLQDALPSLPSALNPLNIIYSNHCIEDLGCFYTGPPFYHPIHRPFTLSPADVDVKFRLYTAAQPKNEVELNNTLESLYNTTFNPRHGTKFLIHGFMSDLTIDDVRFETKDALLSVGDFNVIIVDWTENNGPPYSQAASNTRVVGAKVARLVHFLMNETSIRPEDVHIIGHSLGAHASGYAGALIPNLGRISGLDPAGPYFQELDPEVRLDRSDATFVDVIHTDGAQNVLGGDNHLLASNIGALTAVLGLGIAHTVGHMDFFPNGGRLQLGCTRHSENEGVVGTAINFTTKWLSSGCDHSRANVYYLESIKNRECRFEGVLCDAYSQYQKGECANNTRAEMGFYAKMLPGLPEEPKFYLRTRANSTFCYQEEDMNEEL